MGQIERALARLRERRPAEGRKRSTDAPPAADFPAMPLPSVAVTAKTVALDPDTLHENRVIVHGSDANSSAYKMLRTRVLQRMRANGWKKLAITAPRAHAGKTLTAINTAITLAQDPNQQVFLVDLDLRNPSISSYLGLHTTLGVGDILLHDTPLEQVIVKPDIPRLFIVPSNEAFEDSSEMLGSPQMLRLTQAVADMATIVIFDLPPLLEADDMLAFSPQVDALLLIVAQGETRQADLERAADLIKDMNVLGTVLNKSDEDAGGYY